MLSSPFARKSTMQGALAACTGNIPTILCQNRGLVHGRSIREGEGCSVVQHVWFYILLFFRCLHPTLLSLFLSLLYVTCSTSCCNSCFAARPSRVNALVICPPSLYTAPVAPGFVFLRRPQVKLLFLRANENNFSLYFSSLQCTVNK